MASCLAPIIKKKEVRKSGRDYATDAFPCGKCLVCVKRRVAQWVWRLEKEKEVSSTSAFVTLTYTDDNLPYSPNGYPTLHKPDWQKFMKRLRKTLYSLKYYEKIKYYACGEYGTETYRPHYHAIMFNLPVNYLSTPEWLEKDWQHGMVHLGDVTGSSCAYVAGYINKRSAGVETLLGDDRIPEFSLMSKRLGENYVSEAIQKYYALHHLPYLLDAGGERRSMPRYIKEKLYSEIERKVIAAETAAYYSKEIIDERKFNEWKKDQFRQAAKLKRIKRKTL